MRPISPGSALHNPSIFHHHHVVLESSREINRTDSSQGFLPEFFSKKMNIMAGELAGAKQTDGALLLCILLHLH